MNNKQKHICLLLTIVICFTTTLSLFVVHAEGESEGAPSEDISVSISAEAPSEEVEVSASVEATPTTEETPSEEVTPTTEATAEPTSTPTSSAATPAAQNTVTPEGLVSATASPTPSPTKAPTKKPTSTPLVVVPPDEEENYSVKETDKAATVKGTPEIVVDGVKDSFWDSSAAYDIQNIVWGISGATATFQIAWDYETVYYWIEVTDTTLDVSSEVITRQDSVEIFLDETGLKPSTYSVGNQHYIISRNGGIKYGSGASEDLISYFVKETDTGYIVEAAISFVSIQALKGMSIGVDVRINDSFGEQKRDYIVQWSDTSMQTHQNLSKIATIVLE